MIDLSGDHRLSGAKRSSRSVVGFRKSASWHWRRGMVSLRVQRKVRVVPDVAPERLALPFAATVAADFVDAIAGGGGLIIVRQTSTELQLLGQVQSSADRGMAAPLGAAGDIARHRRQPGLRVEFQNL